MIKRICATLAIAITYFFLSVQGMPEAAPIHEPLMQTGAHATGEKLSNDVIISKTSTGRDDFANDTSVLAASIVARYNESDQAWTFFAKIVQVKDVSIYGRPGTIARVEYMREGEPQYVWTVVQIDDYYFTDDNSTITEGQEIRLEVSGEYVSSKGVNWDACARNDKYCQYASFIEGGFPASEDYNGLTLCHSNVLIYSGYASDDWINGMLAWKIKIGD